MTVAGARTNRGASASISLCMIARDAEESLPTALESARPCMDELVVVDTGSQDATPRIARELGARVFHFAWCDDFSAARNFSLDQAVGDWVFWMDADDLLPPESGRELRRLVEEHPERDAAFWVMVEQESIGGDGRARITRHGHLKLFPRRPEIRFRYRVHEQVAPAIKRLGLAMKASRVAVRHGNADRSAEGNARRRRRNLRLLRLDLADHPDDPFVLLNLGMAHLHEPGGLSAAVDFTRRSIAGFPPGSPTRTNAHLVLATAHHKLGDQEAELEVCRRAHAEAPDDASAMLRLAEALERRGELVEAADCYRTLLRSGKIHLSVFHVPDVHSRAALRLGRLYLQRGRRDEVERLWREFIERHPRDRTVRKALEELYLKPYSIIVY